MDGNNYQYIDYLFRILLVLKSYSIEFDE